MMRRKGALAVLVTGKDLDNLTVVAVGENGRLLDAHSSIVRPPSELPFSASKGERLQLPDITGPSPLTVWNEGKFTDSDRAYPYTALALYRAAKELDSEPVLVYQDGTTATASIVTRKLTNSGWDKPLMLVPATGDARAYYGTSLAVIVDPNATPYTTWISYQSQMGHFCLLKCVSGSDPVTFMCTPFFRHGTPFTAVGSLGDSGFEFHWFFYQFETHMVTGLRVKEKDLVPFSTFDPLKKAPNPYEIWEIPIKGWRAADLLQLSAVRVHGDAASPNDRFDVFALHPELPKEPGKGLHFCKGLAMGPIASVRMHPKDSSTVHLFVNTFGEVMISYDIQNEEEWFEHQVVPLDSMKKAYAWTATAKRSSSKLDSERQADQQRALLDSFRDEIGKMVQDAVAKISATGGGAQPVQIADPRPLDRLGRKQEPISNRRTKRLAWAHKGCIDVPQTQTGTTTTSGLVMHAVMVSQNKLWTPLGQDPVEIKYTFIDGTAVQHQKVAKTIPEWCKFGHLKFTEVKDKADASIRIQFDADNGSWSFVGKDCNKRPVTEPTMNLGWIDPKSTNIPSNERGVILHEFGHALGLLHEHQSPARTYGRTKMQEAATIQYYQHSGLNWSPEMVQSQILSVYNTKEVSSFSQLDIKSIMHYPMPKEVTGLKDDIPYNSELSPLDKAYTTINYPFPAKAKVPTEWSLSVALEVAGVPAELAREITRLANDPAFDVSEIRSKFAHWAQEAHHTTHKEMALSPAISDRIHSLPVPDTHEDADNLSQPIINSSDCATPSPATQNTISGAQHAVSVRHLLWDLEEARDSESLLDYHPKVELKYHVIDSVRSPTQYQLDRLRTAMDAWERCCCVRFVAAEEGDTPPLRILIELGEPNDFERRSYTEDIGTTITLVPSPKPTVVLYLFESEDESIAWDKKKKKSTWLPGKDLNLRSCLHELGHVLGLVHEHNGPFEFLADVNYEYHDKSDFWQKQVIGTRFDVASIMNVPGSTVQKKFKDRLKDYGFGAENLTKLRIPWLTQLSTHDKMHVALIYPGAHLLANFAKSPPDLKPNPENTTKSVIRSHCETLGIPGDDVTYLEGFAQDAKWTMFRAKYLLSLNRAMETKWSELDKLVKTKGDGCRVFSIPQNPVHGLPTLPSTSPSPSFKDILYEKLNNIFGPSGNQYLALQLPSRYLDKETFVYKTAGIYSNFTKPVVVNEAEFRLTDELFDVGKFVSAPNGQSLAIAYEQALNNLVPKYQADPLRVQRERIRSWLLGKVDDSVLKTGSSISQSLSGQGDTSKVYGMRQFQMLTGDDNAVSEESDHQEPHQEGRQHSIRPSNSITRIELSQQLMLDYLQARMDWETLRSKMIAKAVESGDNTKLEQVTRLLSHITSVHENRLAAKYGDVVVRGHLHTVREYLGYLDVKSTSGFLQAAKDSLRESALSSVYSSRTIYPVLMQPVDWFEALDTSFSAVDLSQTPAAIEMQINQRSTKLDELNSSLVLYASSAEGNVATLKAEVESVAQARDDAQANLTRQYTAQTIAAVKMYVEAQTHAGGASSGLSKLGTAIKGDAPPEKKSFLESLDLKAITDGINAVSDAEGKVLSSARALASKMAQLEKARAADTRAYQATLQRQISKTQSEIEALELRLEAARIAEREKVNRTSESTKAIKLPAADDARWQDVVIESEVSNEESHMDKSSSASTSSWNVNLWLGSASGNSSRSSASYTAQTSSSKVKVSLSFRATLVTVDRSGWFQPQFFSMTESFMRVSEHVRSSQWPSGVKTTSEMINRIHSDAHVNMPDSLFPAFPAGYIIAKDILIKISAAAGQSSVDNKSLSEQAAASGGILCFSYSHASSSSSESSHMMKQEMSDGLILKIPGPQILGYVMQLTPEDKSSKFEPMKADVFIPGDQGNSERPAHGMPSVADPQGQKSSTQGPTETITKPSPNEAAHTLPPPSSDEHARTPGGKPSGEEMSAKPAAGFLGDLLNMDSENLKLIVELAGHLN